MKVIRLTGADTYASERTYGFMLKRNQTIKLRDIDADRILQSTQSGVPLFTLTALTTATFDATQRYSGDDPVVYDAREGLFLAGEGRETKIPARVSGAGILTRGSTPYTTPTLGGTNGAMSFGGKKRRMDWAGVAGQYVFRGGTMHMGDLQFGTRSTDTPANFSTSAYVTDIETGGAKPALYTPVTANGTMSIAGGRFRHRGDGSVRIMHYADDALYSSAPRFQFTSFLMPNRVPLRTSLVVQFGDDETQWPAYLAGKQNSLFWQIKGATGQPPLALNVERQSDGSLKLYFNRKRSNATGIWTAGTVSGLAVNTPISIQIDYTLDWLTLDEGGKAFIALTVNNTLVPLTDSAGDVEGTASVGMPTVFTDVDQAYNMINGIYRYDYAAVKAPNDAAMIYWLHETRVRAA